MTTPNSNMHFIYRIVNFRDGKVYVGQTTNFHRRISQHLNRLEKQCHVNKHLQNAYNRDGRDAFYFELIECDIHESKINEREQYWIEYFDSYKCGYNSTLGGELGLSRGKTCVWNGIEYESIAICGRVNGINTKTMAGYISKGFTQDSDLPKSSTNSKKCIWNGIEYKTVSDCATANGFCVSRMSELIKEGYVCSNEAPTRGENRKRKWIWNGIEYYGVSECAKANGVTTSVMWQRLNCGYTCDADMPGKWSNPTGKQCTWNGINYLSQGQCATAIGVSRGAMHLRIKKGYKCDTDVKQYRKKDRIP